LTATSNLCCSLYLTLLDTWTWDKYQPLPNNVCWMKTSTS
jgi:hypothetical protein